MGVWISQHFFNPTFVLPGAALVAAPILIHLINRLRYRRVRFAAMEFLLQSEQRNRRRLMFEQLLLLLLRIVLVLMAVAIIARLILDPAQLSVFRGAKAHHVVLLDDSGSMRNRWADTSAFDEATEVVRSLVAEGTRRPHSQRFTLLVLSDPDKPLFADRDVNEPFLGELENKLENLHCTHRAPELMTGLDAAARLLNDDRIGARHLHVISDFRQHDWLDQTAVAGKLTSLDESGIDVNIVRTVPERSENLGITGVTTVSQTTAAGVPVRLEIAVRNFGDKPAREVRVSINADGHRLPLSVVFDEIPAGEEVTQNRDITFDEPGQHHVRVGLDPDSLATDNERFISFDIAAANPVLIIDGDNAANEAAYVSLALAPDATLTGVAPRVEAPGFLRTQPLDEFRSILMLNVSELQPDALDPLRQYVAGGGGLIWFMGDLVNPSWYNNTVYHGGRDGLFPVPLSNSRRQVDHDDVTNPGPDLVLADHPVFRIMQGQDNPFVETVRIDEWLPVAEKHSDPNGTRVEWSADDNVRRDGVTTIARLRNRQALAFEHRYGRTGGRVVTFLTSAGPAWNNWAKNPSYVVVLLELYDHVAKVDQPSDNRIVGEAIELTVSPTEYLETVEIVQPESTGNHVTSLKAAPATASADGSDSSESMVDLIATFYDTDAPGIYRVRLIDHDQAPHEQWMAFNVPESEGDLRLASPEEVLGKLGGATNVRIQPPGSLNWIQGRDAGQEIRELLLYVFLILLVIEQLLAWKLSYHPQIAGAAA